MIRVIVVNWNAADLTSRCLRSIEATEWPPDALDIVVVDNGSIDGSLEILRRRHPTCRFIANGANLGFAEGCNRALGDLDAVDHVALVNNDTVVEPDWLAPMVEMMDGDPRIGAVSPRMVFDRWFQSVRVDVSGTGARARLTALTVNGVDRRESVICRHGVSRPPHPSIPLRLEIEIDESGELVVPVPDPTAGGPAPRIALTFSTDRWVAVHCGGDDGEATPTDGSLTVTVSPTADPQRVINSLGTGLTEWCEGFERRLGDPDEPDIESETVEGWTGGGVLLRAAALTDVGLFDPTYFMYYEDTDLSWRMRRSGWLTRTCPRSVIYHRLGATAGSSWPGFFYLNYRNWLLTVIRNGSPSEIRRALRAAWRNSWPFIRRNVVGRARRLQRPDGDIAGRWVRIALGTIVALPRTLGARSRRTGRLLGRTPVDAVASSFLAVSEPSAPQVDPDGPTLVYVDVTDTLGSRWRAGIQRVVTELVTRLIVDHPELAVVPIRWSPLDQRYRRLDPAETDALFEPPPMPNHPPPTSPPTPPPWRRLVSRVAAMPALRRRIDDRRRAVARRNRPASDAALLIPRFEPGSVFLDADASWNLRDIPRSRLFPQLESGGVRVVSVLHDILPVSHPQWFDPHLATVFATHVNAVLAHADTIVTSSEFSAGEIEAAGRAAGRDDVAVTVVTLGSDPGSESGEPSDERLLGSLEGRRIILTVGTLEPRKNHAALLDAFDLVDADATLVIVGRQGWRIDPLAERLRAHPLFGDRLVWPPEVNDATLGALYDIADVVAIASFAEGYGLPVVEALRHGCRVVSSEGGSLREVGGDAVTYVDVTDCAAFAAALDNALDADDPPEIPADLPRWDDAASALAALLTQ